MGKNENTDYGFVIVYDNDWETCHLCTSMEEAVEYCKERLCSIERDSAVIYKAIETHTLQQKIIIKKEK